MNLFDRVKVYSGNPDYNDMVNQTNFQWFHSTKKVDSLLERLIELMKIPQIALMYFEFKHKGIRRIAKEINQGDNLIQIFDERGMDGY